MAREHPTAQHVTHGMPDLALDALDDRTKALVVKLMARVAERAYRRGAQQGAHIALTRPADLPRSLAAWPYRPSADPVGSEYRSCGGLYAYSPVCEWRTHALRRHRSRSRCKSLSDADPATSGAPT
jgi:hypothetical protein